MARPSLHPSKIVFVLPGDGRSGGVRVTVIMANILRNRGHSVRIALPHRSDSIRGRLAKLIALAQGHGPSVGFLHEFGGKIEKFHDLNDLTYEGDEVVIAVGTYSVPHVKALNAPIIKLRYNHGFPARPDANQELAWQGTIPTITVSNTLVPKLKELTKDNVIGVVPNGIDTSIYFPTRETIRDGIGALYNSHPNKAPEDMITVLRQAHKRWPLIPQHVFSTESRPRLLEHVNFTRLPPVAEARAIYNRCKIWLLTSRTEGLPGVVLEAMACGCVVVSTDNDGSLEIIRHDHNGIIVPLGNLQAFETQIARLLGGDELFHRLANEAQKTAQEFTWDRAADKMEAVLQQLRERQRISR